MVNELIEMFSTLEGLAVITGLGFIILMIKQNIWCWPIGIISSLASIYLFYESKLYMESILYVFYVLVGIYGWKTWSDHKSDLQVKSTGLPFHAKAIGSGIALALGLGFLSSNYTDAERPFPDAFSTIFSFIASYMEAHKLLSSWIFWIVINLFSIWLYLDRGLRLYSGLMVIYFLLSVAGYLQWRKELTKSNLSLEEHAIENKLV